MARRKDLAEDYWRSYCGTQVADFFRALWWLSIEYGNLHYSWMHFRCADMTILPLGLDGLSAEQAQWLEERWAKR